MLINMILDAQNSTYNKFQMTIAEILIVYLLSELLNVVSSKDESSLLPPQRKIII